MPAIQDSGARTLERRIVFVAIAVSFVFPLTWVLWLWPFRQLVDPAGSPIGGDFPAFYVAARMLADHASTKLYDLHAQFGLLHALFPSLASEWALPFLYPPFVATVVRPLGALGYGWAFGVFTVGSLALWGLTIALLQRTLPLYQSRWRNAATWGLVGTPLLWESLLGGQASVWGCAVLAATVYFISAESFVAAGTVLSLAAYKPNALLFVGIGLLIRYPRLLLGGALGASMLFFAGAVGAGRDSWPDYIAMLQSPDARLFVASPPFEKYHGLLRTTPWLRDHLAVAPSLAIGTACAVAIALWWRRAHHREDSSFAIGLLLVTQALLNPYEPIYDLLQLSLAAVLLADATVARGAGMSNSPVVSPYALLLLIFAGPYISQSISISSGVQPFSVLLLTATLWLMRRYARDGLPSEQRSSG